MNTFQDNNEFYNIAIQVIDRANNSAYQELYIYPGREFIIYDWYWSMAYTCVIDPSDDNFIFSEFAKTVFKSGEYRIDSRISQMFWKVYEHFYGLVQQYRKSE